MSRSNQPEQPLDEYIIDKYGPDAVLRFPGGIEKTIAQALMLEQVYCTAAIEGSDRNRDPSVRGRWLANKLLEAGQLQEEDFSIFEQDISGD